MNLFKNSFRITKTNEPDPSDKPSLSWKQGVLYAIAAIALILAGAFFIAVKNEQGVEIPNAIEWAIWIAFAGAGGYLFSKMNRRITRR